MTDNNCLFCQIVTKKIPASIVYENDDVLAFNDINPCTPTHILLIPKIHVKDFHSLKEINLDLMKELTKACQAIIKKLNLGIGGYRLVINSGEQGGQTVFHLHMHLLSGRNLSWPPG